MKIGNSMISFDDFIDKYGMETLGGKLFILFIQIPRFLVKKVAQIQIDQSLQI